MVEAAFFSVYVAAFSESALILLSRSLSAAVLAVSSLVMALFTVLADVYPADGVLNLGDALSD